MRRRHFRISDLLKPPLSFAVFTAIVVVVWLVEIYEAEAITLRITNARTGKPVSNVIVSVYWELRRQSWVHGSSAHLLRVSEQLTDSEGIVIFSGWRRVTIDIRQGTVSWSQPTIRILQRSYEPRVVTGLGTYEEPVNREYRIFSADYGSDEYRKALSALDGSLFRIRMGYDCAWQKIPKLLVEVENLRMRLDGLGIAHTIPKLKNLGNQRICGNAKSFFDEHGRIGPG